MRGQRLISENLRRLRQAVGSVVPPDRTDWLDASLASVSNEVARLAACMAMARRKLGTAPLGAGAPELESGAGAIRVDAWEAADAGRVALCLAACSTPAVDAHETVRNAFRTGDERERVAIIRGLAAFPKPRAFTPLALEAGRANSLLLFSALALDNPYPAAYYAPQEFNQMVLKALFNRLPISRIEGLQRRAGPELERMCADYIDELRAAGREAPADIGLLMGSRPEVLPPL